MNLQTCRIGCIWKSLFKHKPKVKISYDNVWQCGIILCFYRTIEEDLPKQNNGCSALLISQVQQPDICS